MTPDLMAFLLVVTLLVCATIVVCVHKASTGTNLKGEAGNQRDETIEELSRCIADLATISMNAAVTQPEDQVNRIEAENESERSQGPRRPRHQTFPGPMERMSDSQSIPHGPMD